MTSLTRPVAGDPLSLSNGKASTVIIDEAFDVIEANESALALRSSSTVVMASAFADIPAQILDTAETTTNWKVRSVGPNGAISGPTLDATYFTQGSNSVKAQLRQALDTPSPPGVGPNYLACNFTSPVIPATGQYILIDVMCSVADLPGDILTIWSFRLSDQTQTGGAWRGTTYSLSLSTIAAQEFTGLGTWVTIALPATSLSSVSSVAVANTTAGSGQPTFYMDQPRLSARTGLDQAYGSSASATAIVPASYTTAVEQQPLIHSEDKGLLDLRFDNAVHAGLGGVRNIREWGNLDVTGTLDMTADFQSILDGLDPGTVLECNATDVLKLDKPFFMRVDGVTLDMRGGAITTSLRRGDVWCTVQAPDVTMKNGRMYGFKGTGDGNGGTIQNGSLLATVAGTPGTVGTTRTLSTLNDAVNLPKSLALSPNLYYYFSRDEQNRNRFDFTLSDTTHVASDCVITATTPDGTVIKTQAFTLTGTPTITTFYVENPPITERLNITVKKATATANVITITTYSPFNYTLRSLGNSPVDGGIFANNTFIDITGVGQFPADNCTIENWLVEGSQGNGVRVNYGPALTPFVKGARLHNVTARCCGQHGFTLNNGLDIEMTDCDAIGCERWGIDIEPETTTALVRGLSVSNFRVINAGLGPWDCEGWIRVFDVNADGLYFYSDHQTFSWFTGLGTNCRFSNILAVRTDVPTNTLVFDFASFLGTNCVVDGMHLDGCIQVPDSTRADAAAVNRRTEYLSLRNIYLPKPGGIACLWVQAPRCVVDGLRIGSSYETPIATNQSLMPFMVQNDTVVRNADLGRFAATFPNTFKGSATTNPWFVNGLDMKAESLSNTRGLSGGSVKSNNLRGLSQAVTAGSTTATVAFAGKATGTLVALSKFQGATGGTLVPSTSYFYKVASRTIQSGPQLPTLAQLSTSTGVAETGICLDITGTLDVTNGIYVEGLTIYRGTVSNTYTTRFDVFPNSALAGWGDPGASFNQVFLVDKGATIDALSGQRYYGYTLPTTAQSGSFVPVDESGWEPDTSFSIYLEPSWQTTWRISAKRTNGFDIEFGVACPVGGGTVSWFLVR